MTCYFFQHQRFVYEQLVSHQHNHHYGALTIYREMIGEFPRLNSTDKTRDFLGLRFFVTFLGILSEEELCDWILLVMI